MKPRHLLLAVAVTAGLLAIAGCKKQPAEQPQPGVTAAPEGETADEFVARVNDEIRKGYKEQTSSQWLSSTYINDDSELIAAKANERFLTQLRGWIEQSRKYDGQDLKPETARAILMLKQQAAMPPPKDPAKLEALTQLATKMEGMYGKGEYCKGEGSAR